MALGRWGSIFLHLCICTLHFTGMPGTVRFIGAPLGILVQADGAGGPGICNGVHIGGILVRGTDGITVSGRVFMQGFIRGGGAILQIFNTSTTAATAVITYMDTGGPLGPSLEEETISGRNATVHLLSGLKIADKTTLPQPQAQ